MHVGMKHAVLIIQITSAIVLRVVNRKRRPERHPQVPLPSGSVGVVFEVGMKWEWVEGAWGTYQCEACSLDYGIQFVLPFSSLPLFKWQGHGSGQYLFLLLQLVID